MVNIAVSHTAARGSIPRVGTYFLFCFSFLPTMTTFNLLQLIQKKYREIFSYQ